MSASVAFDMAAELERALGELLPLDAAVRRAESQSDLTGDTAKAMTALGLIDAAVPETAGGLGLDAADIAELWYVAGRHLLPSVVREEVLVLMPILAASGATSAASGHLSLLRSGALRGGGRVLLSGPPESGVVEVWCHADTALVSLLGPSAGAVYSAVPSGAARNIDPTGRWGSVDVTADRMIAAVTGDVARRLWMQWQVAVLAEISGCADRVLELAIAYARRREQFGRPIATFQAVSHMLADARVQLDAARALVAVAVTAIAEADEDSALALARHAVPVAARSVCEIAIQVHGGSGFTWDFGLHLYYRRVLDLQLALGGSDGSARAVGELYLTKIRDDER